MEQEIFKYRGKTLDELQKMDVKDFAKLVTSRKRRSLMREFHTKYAPLLKKVQLAKEGKRKKPVKTHKRAMIVLPQMVGLTVHVHKGKEFEPILITQDMLGMYFGELTLTRRRLVHGAAGIGATKSSTAAASKAK